MIFGGGFGEAPFDGFPDDDFFAIGIDFGAGCGADSESADMADGGPLATAEGSLIGLEG